MEQQRDYPGATGDFTGLLTQIALAAKVIAREVNKAGLVNILGFTGEKNVQGEQVTKLDVFAHQTLVEALEASGHVCAMASEEAAEPILPAPGYPRGPYVVLFDPLDGSSNIDINITIGTIFSIHRKVSPGPDSTVADLLQPGVQQVAAGYVVYGSSTMFIYTATACMAIPSIRVSASFSCRMKIFICRNVAVPTAPMRGIIIPGALGCDATLIA